MKNHKVTCAYYTKLVTNREDWIDSLRFNIFKLLEEDGVTVQVLADTAGVNYETFKSFLYGKGKNCKMGSIVAVAQAYGIPLDELVGSATLTPRERYIIDTLREMPENIGYFIEWAVRAMAGRLSKQKVERSVALMRLQCDTIGDLRIGADSDVLDISSCPDYIQAKVKFAFHIPCDYYMPHYSPYMALLVANDRPALPGEHVLIRSSYHVWIATRRLVDGLEWFYSIRDGQVRCSSKEIDEVIGYVAGTIDI